MLFESDKLITEDAAGQPYQVVKIVVNKVTYYATGPQVVYGSGIGADDMKIVQVNAVQRQAVLA